MHGVSIFFTGHPYPRDLIERIPITYFTPQRIRRVFFLYLRFRAFRVFPPLPSFSSKLRIDMGVFLYLLSFLVELDEKSIVNIDQKSAESEKRSRGIEFPMLQSLLIYGIKSTQNVRGNPASATTPHILLPKLYDSATHKMTSLDEAYSTCGSWADQ
jgi:hypothetical protein